MRSTNKRLSELNDLVEDVPQVLINTRVKNKQELTSIDGYADLHKSIQQKLKGAGRLFVRFSGTEPVVRVLVEGPDKKEITEYAEEMAQFLQYKLGK